MYTTTSRKEKIITWSMLAVILLTAFVLVVVFKESLMARAVHNFISTNNYRNVLVGLGNTFIITISGFIIGLILGIGVSILQNMPSKNTFFLMAKQLSHWYVSLFRGTPIAVQLLIIYFIIFSAYSGDPLGVAIVAFGLNSGAYIAEIIRGGIQSVSKGQMEAGRSLGLPYATVMFKIIIPQALRNAMPSLFNEIITLVKETSIAGFIGAVDLTLAFRKIANATYDYEMVYLVMGLIYFILILLITKLLGMLEKKVTQHDRT